MYSNQMRITGLGSGMDIEAMVTNLMKAEGMRMTKLTQQRQLLEWKQSSYRSVSSVFEKFQTDLLSLSAANSLRMSSSFNSIKTMVKDKNGDESTALTVTGTPRDTGDMKLKIHQVASEETYIGKPTTGGYKANTIFDSAAFDKDTLTVGDSFTVSLDGSTTATITFTESDIAAIARELDPARGGTAASDREAMQNVVNQKLADRFGYAYKTDANGEPVKDADGNYVFQTDSNGNKIQKVSLDYEGFTDGSNTGRFVFKAAPGHEATIGNGTKYRNLYEKLGFKTDKSGSTAFSTSQMIGVGLGLTGGASFTVNDVTFNFKSTDTIDDVIKKVNESDAGVKLSYDKARSGFVLKSAETGEAAKIKFANDPSTKEFFSALGINSHPITANDTIAEALGLEDDLGTGAGGVDLGDGAAINIEGKTFRFTRNTTIQQMMDTINSDTGIDVKMSFDSETLSFSYTKENGDPLTPRFGTGPLTTKFLDAADDLADKADLFKDSQHIAAKDTLFTYNGSLYSRESANFQIDGVNVALTDAAEGEEFTISATRDTEAVKETVVKFVEEYNKLMQALADEINTSRPKSGKYDHFDPLTDDQKEAMSDREVELWEEKAKKGMLYRDDLLSGIAREMRNMMYAPVELEDGSTISLYHIGITTSNKNGSIGMLQIDDAKLENALTNDADAVSQMFTKSPEDTLVSSPSERKARMRGEGLAYRLDDIIENMIGSGGSIQKRAGLEGTGSVVNNDLYYQMSDYDDRIDEMTDYLIEKEEHYYNMFAKMEAAMNQSNSQLSALLGSMGG